MSDKNLIAYCGACTFKVAYDTNDRRHLLIPGMPSKYDVYKTGELRKCVGCKLDTDSKDCKIRNCAKAKGLTHCGLCVDFSCEIISNFNNDGAPHHSEAIKNLKQLKDIGEKAWLTLQEKRWTCQCGAKMSWYLQKCLSCSKEIK